MKAQTISKPSPVKAWILAARPKTLLLTFAPIMTGAFIAHTQGYAMNGLLILCALLSSCLITVGTNFFNDAIDFNKGSDTEERLGFKRAVQSGWLSARQVMWGGFIAFALAELIGLPLVIEGGLPMLALLAISPICGYFYTGGKYPLAYIGLGEVFVMLFYGVASALTGYYLLAHSFSLLALVAGIQMGCLSCIVISINNLRDIYQDRKSNKKTLAVRLGKDFARFKIACFAFLPFLLNLVWMDQGYSRVVLPTFFLLPMAFWLVKQIYQHEPGAVYNQFFAMAARLHFFFGLGLWIRFFV